MGEAVVISLYRVINGVAHTTKFYSWQDADRQIIEMARTAPTYPQCEPIKFVVSWMDVGMSYKGWLKLINSYEHGYSLRRAIGRRIRDSVDSERMEASEAETFLRERLGLTIWEG